jgi:very-short-patch-repair endonuclease
VNPLLRSLLDAGDGVVTWAEAAQVAPPWMLEWASRAGHLHRVLPGVYSEAGGPEPGFDLLRRAALAWAGPRGALSHLTALDVWGLRAQRSSEPVHLSAPAGAGLRSRPGFVVHQRRGLAIQPPQVLIRRGMPVTRIERCLVESWPLLPPVDRPAPAIRAVNDRLTTPDRIDAALAEVPRLTGRAELRNLVNRLAAGCRSPLEIWGRDHVFAGPGMPPFERQTRIRAAGRTYYLDVYARRERVNFELDGATTHGDPRQRELDLRRDALLATLGILVVRYPHRRLIHEPAEVRREVLEILATRHNHR